MGTMHTKADESEQPGREAAAERPQPLRLSKETLLDLTPEAAEQAWARGGVAARCTNDNSTCLPP